MRPDEAFNSGLEAAEKRRAEATMAEWSPADLAAAREVAERVAASQESAGDKTPSSLPRFTLDDVPRDTRPDTAVDTAWR